MALLFSFEDMGSDEKMSRSLKRAFGRVGAKIVQVEVDGKIRRNSGVSYKEVALVCDDSQTVTLQVKATGDIFAVKVNGKVVPIKNQDDHDQAVGEIAKQLNVGRAKFQQKLAQIKIKLPAGIRTAAPRMEQALKERLADLDDAIVDAKAQLEALT